MKHLIIILFTSFLALNSFAQTFNQGVADIIDQVDQNSLIYYLRNISGEDPVMVNGVSETIEHRVSSWGNNLAADYIEETLEGFGLTTTVQNYSSGGRNVYGIQEGAEYPDEYIMICAHYDSVSNYCADDNGSGTAGVLEAARILSNLDFEYSIIYALWDEEEIGLVGSDYFATQASNNGDIIHAVINMDMISWDGDGDMVVEVHASGGGSSALANYVIAINDIYNLQLETSLELPGTGASDQASFWYNGYSAILLIEEYYGGDFNPYYHSASDRIGILDMDYFHEMSKLAIGSLASKAVPLDTSGINDELVPNSAIQLSNYPNPFSEKTKINYSLEDESFVRISLINSLGEEIKVLVEDVIQGGDYQYQFHAGNLPNGLYYIVMQSPKATIASKLLIK